MKEIFFHENLSGRLLGRHALNFSLKLQKLRTNLDMWQSRDNPLWKNINHQTLGITLLIVMASNSDLM